MKDWSYWPRRTELIVIAITGVVAVFAWKAPRPDVATSYLSQKASPSSSARISATDDDTDVVRHWTAMSSQAGVNTPADHKSKTADASFATQKATSLETSNSEANRQTDKQKAQISALKQRVWDLQGRLTGRYSVRDVLYAITSERQSREVFQADTARKAAEEKLRLERLYSEGLRREAASLRRELASAGKEIAAAKDAEVSSSSLAAQRIEALQVAAQTAQANAKAQAGAMTAQIGLLTEHLHMTQRRLATRATARDIVYAIAKQRQAREIAALQKASNMAHMAEAEKLRSEQLAAGNLQQEVASLHERLTRAEEKVATAEQTVASNRSTAAAEIAALQTTAAAKLADSEKQAEQSKAQVSALTRRIEDFQVRLSTRSTARDVIYAIAQQRQAREILDLEQAAAPCNKEADERLQSEQRTSDELRKEAASLRERLESAERKMASIGETGASTNSASDTKIAAPQAAVRDAEARAAKVLSYGQEAAHRADAVSMDLERARDLVASAQLDLSALQSEKRENGDLRQEAASLRDRLATAQEQAASAEKAAIARAAAAESKNAALQSAAQDAEARAAKALADSRAKANRADALALDLEHAHSILSKEQRASSTSLQDARLEHEHAAAACAADRTVMEQEIAGLRAAKDHELARNDHLTAALQASEEAVAQERAQHTSAVTALNRSEAKASTWLADILQIRARLASLRRRDVTNSPSADDAPSPSAADFKWPMSQADQDARSSPVVEMIRRTGTPLKSPQSTTSTIGRGPTRSSASTVAAEISVPGSDAARDMLPTGLCALELISPVAYKKQTAVVRDERFGLANLTTLHVLLRFASKSEPAQRHASFLKTLLHGWGLDVSEAALPSPNLQTSSVGYVYEEDQRAAQSMAAALAPFGSVERIALRDGQETPRPGSIIISIAQ